VNRLVFLDFDGVLNSHRFFFGPGAVKRPDNADRDEKLRLSLDPAAIAHLNTIIERSGAKIVISSSWRLAHSVGTLRRALHQRGFRYADSVVGKTPYSPVGDSTNRRGIEIQTWINTDGGAGWMTGDHGAFDPTIVILDDDRDMGPLLPRLVKTSWETGLLAEHVPMALQLLGVE
jgi:hypothetical protein